MSAPVSPRVASDGPQQPHVPSPDGEADSLQKYVLHSDSVSTYQAGSLTSDEEKKKPEVQVQLMLPLDSNCIVVSPPGLHTQHTLVLSVQQFDLNNNHNCL